MKSASAEGAVFSIESASQQHTPNPRDFKNFKGFKGFN